MRLWRLGISWCWLLLLLPVAGRAEDDPRLTRLDSGDILEIQVPKYPEFSKAYVVNKEGGIALDLIGDLSVRGLTPPELEKKLTARLGEYLRYPDGITVRVAGRRMLIRVLGAVGEPGMKEVPKEANVQEVLAAAGGPQLGAIVTRIVVRRKQEEWVEELPVDLKAYLEGRGTLPDLRSGDEVFVPRVEVEGAVQRPLGPADIVDPGAPGKAQVLGAVKAPGEVTLRDDATLLTALTAAGGWLETGDLTRVRRVPGGQGPAVIFDLQQYLDQGGTVPRVQAGDVITVPSRLGATRVIRVIGAVTTPGPVQLPADGDLQTALVLAGGPLPAGDTRHIRLLRHSGAELERREINLETYLTGADPAGLPEILTGDVIFVPKGQVPMQAPTATVYVFGAVAKPGPYPLIEQRSLLHLLAQAGGTSPTANLQRIRITRSTAGQPPVAFDLQGWQEGRITALPALGDGDTVTVDPNVVSVVGNVAKPGSVEVKTGATVVEALAGAGGPVPTADLTHVVISRLVGRDVQRQNVNLEQYLYQPQLAPPLPTVQAGDVIAVQAATPDQQVVFVLGQVGHPGPVNLPTRRSSVLYALAAAGGPLPTADREQVRIIRPGAGGVKVQLFDLKALTDSTPGAALANPPEVEAGDVVSVDELGKPGRGILVLGAVGRQGRLPVDKGMTVIDVIGLAGGLTQMADVKRAKLIRASGEVIVLDLLAFSKEGAKQPLVQDGDTLAIANLKDTRNIFDELMRYLPFVSFFYRP